MQEFSLHNGILHQTMPQVRLAVHLRMPSNESDGVEMMVSHPACSPFACFCSRNRTIPGGKPALLNVWMQMRSDLNPQP